MCDFKRETVYIINDNLVEDDTRLVLWNDLIGRRIPNKKWSEVSIIANYNGKLVLILSDENNEYDLPSSDSFLNGHIETFLFNVFIEETGGIIVNWEPVGYMILKETSVQKSEHLYIYAKVKNIKKNFINEEGSNNVISIVPVEQLNELSRFSTPIGKHVIKCIKEKFHDEIYNSDALKLEAQDILDKLVPIISKYGDLNFTGSYSWGTMYDRDIDIELWLGTEQIKETQKMLVNDLMSIEMLYELKTRDLISFHRDFKGGRNLKGILIMLKLFNGKYNLWNIDLCLFDKNDDNSNALPFSKEVLSKIQQMSDEQKKLIIDIKKMVTSCGLYLKGRSSVDIYLKVVEEGIKDPIEYMPYARALANCIVEKPSVR